LGNYRPPLLGVVGKTNVGKTTFFSAATLATAEISNRPFTTIKPNLGVAYVRHKCPHVEFGMSGCNPRAGFCYNGVRFVPVELIDVAGLIPGAHKGRGLGNKFMDDVRKAQAFLLVVDASGSTSEEGVPLPPGSRDPVDEVKFVLEEIDRWIAGILMHDWKRFATKVDSTRLNVAEAMCERLSGLNIKKSHVNAALEASGLEDKKPSEWSSDDIYNFAKELRRASKPFIIVANKADLPAAREGIRKLKSAFPDIPIVPVSSQAELALKKAQKAGLIDYIPGSDSFKIVNRSALTEVQAKALEYIRVNVLEEYGSTGVQQALETLLYNVLGYVAVYPVENVERLCDTKGNVLPDVFLVPRTATVKDVASLVHSELAEKFVAAVDVRRKQRLGESAQVYDGIVVKVLASR